MKKKFKDKKFAAGCSREVILQGAEMLGWDLDHLIDQTIQPCGQQPMWTKGDTPYEGNPRVYQEEPE